MVIGLIGMAGIGKSRWAARLADAGFTALHCDDLIAERLRIEHNANTVTVYCFVMLDFVLLQPDTDA